MRVGQTLSPGQRGTKRYTTKYGDRLVCVRYRYDAIHKQRHTTVELIVDTAAWQPPPPTPDTIVGVRVAWGEAAIARQIKKAVGQWTRERQLWGLPYRQVETLQLLDRLVSDVL